jgi:hypothetical protein
MIYLLENGGPQHKTVWYREKTGAPVLQLVNTAAGEYPTENNLCADYSLLEEIGMVNLPLNTWILGNAKILHSVENIPGVRTAIQMGTNVFPSSMTLLDPVYYTEN